MRAEVSKQPGRILLRVRRGQIWGALTLLFVECDLQLLVCFLRRSNLSCHRSRVEFEVQVLVLLLFVRLWLGHS